MIIKKAEYVISGTKFEHFPQFNYPEFVFIGRSNVGKSSLLNAITNRKILLIHLVNLVKQLRSIFIM